MITRQLLMKFYRLKGVSGSLTIEAAIVMPVFICVVVSIAFFIRVAYVHETVQHALDDTANQMACSSYLYYVSGLKDIHDTARDGLDRKSEVFRKHSSSFMDFYESITGQLSGNGSKEENQAEGDVKEKSDRMLSNLKEAAGNPKEEFKSLLALLARGGLEDAKSGIMAPLARFYLSRHFIEETYKDPGKKLLSMNVIGGMEGLDLSDSRFFEDTENNIDLVVKYRLKAPVPLRLAPEILMVQRAVSKAWLDGESEAVTPFEEDVWSIKSEVARGDRIHKIFDENLPDGLPVQIWDKSSGTAVKIVSRDLSMPSYTDKTLLKLGLTRDIKELSAFGSCDKKGVRIAQGEIKLKKLVIVIPRNVKTSSQQEVLDEMSSYARGQGICVEIKEYGIKKGSSGSP